MPKSTKTNLDTNPIRLVSKTDDISYAKPVKAKQENDGLTSQGVPATPSKTLILVIDDDPGFRLLTSSMLSTAGYAVATAASGKEGLELIMARLPGLVLLDAVMPELDGLQTCRLLKQHPAFTDIPIIMVTGLDELSLIHEAFEAGATDFIAKPINYPILIQRINFGLRTSQTTAELRHSQLQLSAAQRIARLGYWTWDIHRDVLTISEQLAELCSIDLKNFDGTLTAFIELIHPADREFVKDIINAAAHSRAIQHIEYRIQVGSSEVIEVQQEIEALSTHNELYITGIVQDISHKKQSDIQIHKLAYFDHLTGLANRAYYEERMKDIIKSAEQRRAQFALMFIDLDSFKEINDRHGHQTGDLVLQETARRLKQIARGIDFIVRFGGDEFCILLNNVSDQSSVAEIAKRCLQKINLPFTAEGMTLKPKASIGIALYPDHGKNDNELMRAADLAMYVAKQSGKQRFVFYVPHMADQGQQRQTQETLVRDATVNNQFRLVYEPQISFRTGKVAGFEALVRWQHPDKGAIPPAELISLIERLGLASRLGRWSIKTACEQMVEWRSQGLPLVPMGVNVSLLYLNDPSFLPSVQEILETTQIPAQYLYLEISENGLQDIDQAKLFNEIRQFGLKIALDDFGSGFSSLKSLKELPIDGIKIDKMFIEDLLSNPHTPLLLGTMIGLANALNLTLVAEGVATNEQAKIMLGLGCHVMQGSLFSKPLSGNQVHGLIEKGFNRKDG